MDLDYIKQEIVLLGVEIQRECATPPLKSQERSATSRCADTAPTDTSPSWVLILRACCCSAARIPSSLDTRDRRGRGISSRHQHSDFRSRIGAPQPHVLLGMVDVGRC